MKLKKEQLLGVARHVLTIGGGYAVGKGIVDETTAMEIVGAISSLIGIIWSIFSPDKKKFNGYE